MSWCVIVGLMLSCLGKNKKTAKKNSMDLKAPLLGDNIKVKLESNADEDEDDLEEVEEEEEEGGKKKISKKDVGDDDNDKIEHKKIMLHLLYLIWKDHLVFLCACICLVVCTYTCTVPV